MLIERDKQILAAMMEGCCTFQELSDAAGKYFKCVKTMRGRIEELVKQGYIASREYRFSKGKIKRQMRYALGQKGVKYACKSGFLKPEEARNDFPSPHGFAHEAGVQSVLKALKREVDAGAYTLRYMDENACKVSRYITGMEVFPDLLVTIERGNPGENIVRKIALEIDMGSIPPERVIKKSTLMFVLENGKRKHIPSLVLCANQRRIRKLQEKYTELVEADESLAVLQQRLFFGVLGKFKGFVGATFVNPVGAKGRVF